VVYQSTGSRPISGRWASRPAYPLLGAWYPLQKSSLTTFLSWWLLATCFVVLCEYGSSHSSVMISTYKDCTSSFYCWYVSDLICCVYTVYLHYSICALSMQLGRSLIYFSYSVCAICTDLLASICPQCRAVCHLLCATITKNVLATAENLHFLTAVNTIRRRCAVCAVLLPSTNVVTYLLTYLLTSARRCWNVTDVYWSVLLSSLAADVHWLCAFCIVSLCCLCRGIEIIKLVSK